MSVTTPCGCWACKAALKEREIAMRCLRLWEHDTQATKVGTFPFLNPGKGRV